MAFRTRDMSDSRKDDIKYARNFFIIFPLSLFRPTPFHSSLQITLKLLGRS